MKREAFYACIVFIFFTVFFFYPVLRGFIPFPGDLLVGNYTPYNSYPFMGYAPGGYPHKAQGFDVLKFHYPVKEFAVTMLKNGQMPLWNPYNFSGNPVFASMQAGTLYPFTLFFLFAPFMLVWSLYILLQPILAGLFTFLLLREFQLSRKSSFFGALAYAFSSYMIVWIEYGNIGHTILWLPLALCLLYRNLKKPNLVQSIGLVLVLTFSLLAGYVQLAIYLFAFLAAFLLFYVVVLQKQNAVRNLFFHLPIFVAPIFLAAIQLLPTIELFSHSTRAQYSLDAFVKLLIPQFHIITAFAPDFFGNPATRNYWLTGTYIERVSYIGVVPLFFAIFGFLQKRTALTWFFAGSLLVIFFLVFDSTFTRALYGLYMPPIISTGVPSRIMFLFCFTASVLAAFGFNSFEKEKSTKMLLKAIAIVGSIYLLLWLFVFIAPPVLQFDWIGHLAISKRNLILPTGIFVLSVLSIIASFRIALVKRYVFLVLFSLTIFELFYFFHKITPFSPKETVYPETEVLRYLKSIQAIDRSWGYGSGYVEANIQTHEKLFSPHGYDPLHIKSYGELLTTSYHGNLDMLPPRSEADIAPGFGTTALRENRFRQRILNLLGVRYLLHKISSSEDVRPDYETFPKEIYTLLWQKGSWQVYENRQSLPRAMFFSHYVVEEERKKIIDMLLDEKFNLTDTVILEESLDQNLQVTGDTEAEVAVVSYTPNRVVLKTKSAGDTILLLSETYFPGWKVSIDGRNGKIYRANYTFRAVPVKKGQHEVVFWYYPDSFDIGLKISAASTIGMLLIGIAMKARRAHA